MNNKDCWDVIYVESGKIWGHIANFQLLINVYYSRLMMTRTPKTRIMKNN